MKPVRKSFNRALYQAYDKKAKDTLVDLLESKGHTIVNTEENYHVDVVSQKDGYTYFNEAEVKVAWTEDWPTHWEEIRIPERKKKLLSKHKGNLTFYIFREDMQQAWCIDSSLLTDDKLKEARGRNIMKGEQFYHIPYVDAQLINVKAAA